MTGFSISPLTWRPALYLGAVCCLGCAASSPPPSQAASEASIQEQSESRPKDVAALFEREQTEPWTLQEVSDPQGKWRAKLEATAPPLAEPQEGFLAVRADLGLDAPLTCLVYDEPIDAGAAVLHILRQAAGEVKLKRVAPYGVTVLAHQPAVFVRALYEAQTADGTGVGDLKLMACPRLDHPVVCMLDAPGYAATFARVAGGLAQSFEWQESPPVPKRLEILRGSLEGTPVGFSMWQLLPDQKNLLRSVSLTSMLIPKSPAQLQVIDSASVVYVQPSGRVTKGTWVSYENAEQQRKLELTSTSGNGYAFNGTVQGKPVKGKFQTRQGLASALTLTHRLRKLSGQGKEGEFELQEYHPGADPTQAQTVTYRFAPGDPEASVRVQLGEVELALTVDADGFTRRVAMPVADTELVFERLDQLGEL
jgi:hypothetical protein